jgi:pimeloyl-ACP methyl ester carboxylesterase
MRLYKGHLLFLFLLIIAMPILADDRGRCTSLGQLAEEGLRVESAQVHPEDGSLPSYCGVRGVLEDRVRFEMRMPVTDWNGKFVVAGCGGFCGSLLPDKPGYSNSINESLKLGYAAITTDGGHEAKSWETDWAQDDPRALELYAGAWMPLAVAAGQYLSQSFYQKQPQRTYFSGCSNGGRLGLFAAQRYPELFDAIAAGGGIFDLTGNSGVHGLWLLQSTRDQQGRAVIDRDKIPVLAEHVRQQCDGLDGLMDGVVSRPEQCRPDIGALQCAAGAANKCFTAVELAAIRRLYQGATVDGRQLFAGIPPGSESLWPKWVTGTDEDWAWGERAAMGNLRLTYGVSSDRPFNPHDYDLAKELDNLQRLAPVLNATDPDISAFAEAGGKLFYYHGLADPLILEGRVRQYYADAVAATGEDRLQQSARFVMVPGHGHCWEKPGQVADDFNPVAVIDRWVESGEAPDYIVAELVGASSGAQRSRKLCPYPQQAQFQGGDADKAENFRCK